MNDKLIKISPQQVTELKGQLRRGDYGLIAEMLNGRYTRETVKAMLLGKRTLKPVVYEAAKRLIQLIENLKQEVQ